MCSKPSKVHPGKHGYTRITYNTLVVTHTLHEKPKCADDTLKRSTFTLAENFTLSGIRVAGISFIST